MLSRNQIRKIRALHRKKARREQQLFLVEGEKMVAELLESPWPVESLYATDAFLTHHEAAINAKQVQPFKATPEELSTAGTLVSNNAAIAIAHIPEAPQWPTEAQDWVLALDNINDPGNLGALLRIADWYGIQRVVCSPTTAELYNPKVINASKGSFLRVSVSYQPLEDFLAGLPPHTPVLGAYLSGKSVHDFTPSTHGGVLLMGSEAHGIHPSLAEFVTHPITIPAYGNAESLNVAVATAVICDNLRRKK